MKDHLACGTVGATGVNARVASSMVYPQKTDLLVAPLLVIDHVTAVVLQAQMRQIVVVKVTLQKKRSAT